MERARLLQAARSTQPWVYSIGFTNYPVMDSTCVNDSNYGPLILDDISQGYIASPYVATNSFPGSVSLFIAWDGTSTQAQASSVYFNTFKGIPGFTDCSSNVCAVELHQSNLK